jgi:hypothetical protein
MKKGIYVTVYRSAGADCTANGITSKVDRIMLVGEGIREQYKVSEDEPYLELVIRPHLDNYKHANVAGLQDDKKGTTMFGGNYVLVDCPVSGKFFLPVHDRFEDWDTYEAMSR